MRTLPISLVLLLWATRLTAQVDLELVLDQEQFLRDEPIPIKLRITNRSGQTLKLGQSNDWVVFSVELSGRGPAERLLPLEIDGAFELESAHVATREINLRPAFDLSEAARYSVSATLRIKDWDREFTARPKGFEVVRGAKLWEQEIGVPSATGSPEVRRFMLQQATYRTQLRLYARLSNQSDTAAYRVLPLGAVVSFGRPEAQVDDRSNLHVLFQTGARSFLYTVIDPDGQMTTRQTYDYGSLRPSFHVNDAGRIFVSGGIRRLTKSDLPPPSIGIPPAPETGKPSPPSSPGPDKDGVPARK